MWGRGCNAGHRQRPCWVEHERDWIGVYSAECTIDPTEQPPRNSLTFRPVVGQLSEIVSFLLLEQRCGTVEWPAKRCYVGLVAVGVQEQAEDILVPPLLRNCLTLNDISFS